MRRDSKACISYCVLQCFCFQGFGVWGVGWGGALITFGSHNKIMLYTFSLVHRFAVRGPAGNMSTWRRMSSPRRRSSHNAGSGTGFCNGWHGSYVHVLPKDEKFWLRIRGHWRQTYKTEALFVALHRVELQNGLALLHTCRGPSAPPRPRPRLGRGRRILADNGGPE